VFADHHGSVAVHVHVMELLASSGELLITETVGATLVRDHVAIITADSFHKTSLTLVRNCVVVGSSRIHREKELLDCRPLHEIPS
jgi:hypothetical protein